MPLIWTDTLATGIRQIDLQHQELIEMINLLEKAHEAGDRQVAFEDVLPRLNAYVLFHFGTEDAMLPDVSTEHAELHRRQHHDFTSRIAALRHENPDKIDLAALIDYLNRWLVEHIMKTDHELARQLKSRHQPR